MRRFKKIWGAALTVLVICGCATPAYYKDVFKEKPTYNSRSFAVSRDILHQATLRAICARKCDRIAKSTGLGSIFEGG